MRKLNRKQERELICGFLASSPVLIFAVIGHNTINIPEIFQLFMTFLVCYTAVFSVVTQRSWRGALRDDSKNGCVADYDFPGRTVRVAKKNGYQNCMLSHQFGKLCD